MCYRQLPDFVLDIPWSGAQPQASFPFPISRSLFLMLSERVFSAPGPSLKGEHILFVGVRDESKENNNGRKNGVNP